MLEILLAGEWAGIAHEREVTKALRWLQAEFARWERGEIIKTASRIAHEIDDISLVGLAARVREPVALTATRESVVLYAERVVGAALRRREPTYVWKVDDELSRAAARFAGTSNTLFDETLPTPQPQNAAYYWHACKGNNIHRRCVRLGSTPTAPIRYYHWALRSTTRGGSEVHEFWHSTVWTTERYRRQNPVPEP